MSGRHAPAKSTEKTATNNYVFVCQELPNMFRRTAQLTVGGLT